MTKHRRRSHETLREVDGLLQAHLQDEGIEGRPLANLAAAMAIEYSGADRGVLMLDSGNGLEPVLALESDLSRSTRKLSHLDLDLIKIASDTQQTQRRGGRLAAPVLVDRLVTCVLFLERQDGPLDRDTVELATGVATRIGALLRSASLVEELSRRSQSVATLEALGACLAAGELRLQHLHSTIDGAVRATGSYDALLTLVDPPDESLRTAVRGPHCARLEESADGWLERIRDGDEADLGAELDRPCLVEPLRADLFPASGQAPGVLGLIAVQRGMDDRAYDEDDRSFFRAVAHLVAGALARMEYFAKAAEDPLTETGSRLALQLGLAEAHANSVTTGRRFSILLLDIDNFKEINDRWGHLTGDEVLRGLAAALRSRLRSTDSVARYGGDEFVLILPSTDAEQAVVLGRGLCELVAGKRFTEQDLSITVSLGAATSDPGSDDIQALLKRADQSLYESKSRGKNRLTHYAELAGNG